MAPFTGSVRVTVGAVVSVAAPVVNVHTLLLVIAPFKVRTPVVIVAVNRVLAGKLLVGVKVAVLPM